MCLLHLVYHAMVVLPCILRPYQSARSGRHLSGACEVYAAGATLKKRADTSSMLSPQPLILRLNVNAAFTIKVEGVQIELLLLADLNFTCYQVQSTGCS